MTGLVKKILFIGLIIGLFSTVIFVNWNNNAVSSVQSFNSAVWIHLPFEVQFVLIGLFILLIIFLFVWIIE